MSKVVLVIEVYPSALSGAQTVLECRNQSFFFFFFLLLWWREIRGYWVGSILSRFSQHCSWFLLLINGQSTDVGSRESGM